MEYSENTKQLAQRYNLTCKDVMFCRLIAAAADAGDAFAAIYFNSQTGRKTNAQATSQATEFIRNNPGAKILINYFKSARQQRARKEAETELNEREQNERQNELSNRAGVLQRLKVVTSNLSGKEELQGLVTIAKMQGFDKPEEHETDEKRVYFLPWVSNCRACKLMDIYIKCTRTRED